MDRVNDTHDNTEGVDAGWPVSRRSVLRGAGAAGVTGALAGCLGTVEREYEATPVSVPAETAREHGFQSEPRVERRTASFSRSVGVADVETEMTGYIYRYEHEGDPAAETEGGGGTGTTPTETPTPTGTPSPTPTETSGPTGTPTDTPTQTPIDTTLPDDDDDDQPETSPTQTPIDTTPTTPEPTTPTGTPTATPTQTPIDTTPTATGTPTTPEGTEPGSRRVEPDTLSITTTPNPSFVGLDLNPAAGKSIESLIQSETAAFEQACGCNIESPGQVEVRSTSTPTETQVRSGDVGRTVFSIDPASPSLDVPESVELMGEQRRLGYFAFVTPAEGEGVTANLVVTAKGTGQSGGGTNEAVVASYFSRAGGLIPPPELSVTASEGAGSGLFTPAQLETAAGRFTPVCPSMTPTPGTETGTATATATPDGPATVVTVPMPSGYSVHERETFRQGPFAGGRSIVIDGGDVVRAVVASPPGVETPLATTDLGRLVRRRQAPFRHRTRTGEIRPLPAWNLPPREIFRSEGVRSSERRTTIHSFLGLGDATREVVDMVLVTAARVTASGRGGETTLVGTDVTGRSMGLQSPSDDPVFPRDEIRRRQEELDELMDGLDIVEPESPTSPSEPLTSASPSPSPSPRAGEGPDIVDPEIGFELGEPPETGGGGDVTLDTNTTATTGVDVTLENESFTHGLFLGNESDSATIDISPQGESVVDRYDKNDSGSIEGDEVRQAISCFLFRNPCIGAERLNGEEVRDIIQEFLFG